MSAKKYRPSASPDQSFLLPPSPREWLDPNHLAFFVGDVVARLDLSAIENVIQSKDPRGERPFAPRMLVGLLLYSYCRGVFSSRRIERATHEDVATRVLAGGVYPDHSTIARFRKNHADALGELFLQVLRLCQEAGLVKLGRVALDGTRLLASASKHKAMSYEYMAKKKELLQAEVAALLAMAEEADRVEDAEQGDANLLLNELPAELQRREDRIRLIDEAMARLEAEAVQARAARLEEQAERHEANAADESRSDRDRKLAATLARKRREQAASIRDDDEPPPSSPSGEPHQGSLFTASASGLNDGAKRIADGLPEHVIRHCRDGAVHPKAQHNFTDPDSRIMEHQGGFVQAFNAQAIATEDQIIVSQGLSNAAPDTYYLQPLVSGVQANCGELPSTLLADAGYWAPSNAGFLEDASIDGYISVGRESHEVDESPSGVDPPATPRDEMRAKLQAPDGREQYRARKWMIEPVFGQIKEAMGFRRFTRRGMPAARAEWAFVCTAHNLLKLWRAGKPLPA